MDQEGLGKLLGRARGGVRISLESGWKLFFFLRFFFPLRTSLTSVCDMLGRHYLAPARFF